MTMKTMTHSEAKGSVWDLLQDVAVILQPAEDMSVAEAAEEYRYLNTPGAYVGPYKNSTSPMMVEPMNTFTSREFTGMIFVGPAQSAKTESMVLNTAAYTIKCDPMDMMIVCPTQTAARDFSMRRVDRMHRYSEEIGAMQLPGADADNKFDKHYRNGMMLSLSWPTPTELAGKPIGRVVLTDRDRMVDDVDGDGEPFDLASKRTTTFMSSAMTVAESSPSREVKNPKWLAASPHEAPPCDGILGLYNRGDRRRWYWPCPHCGKHFEGLFTHLDYERREGLSNLEVAETVRMRCPFPDCGKHIHPDDRDDMQQRGIWLKDNQYIIDGKVYGTPPRTLIASFWLRGVAAAFTNWKKLVVTYLDAQDTFEKTGSEEALKKFYNNDLGEPYIPKSMTSGRDPTVLQSRAEKLPAEDERKVPEGVRFLVALIDVQKNMWKVQIFGILPGEPFDMVLIDRYEVKKSKRMDEDGDAAWVKPAVYLEDWELLIPEVMDKEYELADGSGRMMGVKHTGCDSGGEEGVTGKAYEFYRKLITLGRAGRFTLLKGDPKPGQPRARITHPDANRKDQMANARGEIPVLMLNSNMLKDALDARLDCVIPGKGMYRIPDWVGDQFFVELCSEVRTSKGWEHKQKRIRNEPVDLSYYCIGLCVSQYLSVEKMDWANPPNWAAEWDKNSLVRKATEAPRFSNPLESNYDFSALAQQLA